MNTSNPGPWIFAGLFFVACSIEMVDSAIDRHASAVRGVEEALDRQAHYLEEMGAAIRRHECECPK